MTKNCGILYPDLRETKIQRTIGGIVSNRPTSDNIRTAAQARLLLEVPAVKPSNITDEMRNNPNIIRLPKSGGSFQVPAFQFDVSGRLRLVVAAVNSILGGSGGVDSDCWAICDWWTSPNSRLAFNQCPCQLLGTARANDLLVLANAVRSSG